MGIPLDLLLEAVLFGVLLGGFYAAVSMGLSVSFGLLDVPYVAHPAVMVLGSYCTYLLVGLGLDPVVAGLLLMPPFFVLGMGVYRFYYEAFEKRGAEAGVRGIAFFFGLALIIEVGLILAFGVDQRMVEAAYIGKSIEIDEIRIPLRTLVAFGIAIAMTIVLTLYLSRTFTGRAIKAVAQDEPALRLMGANPVRIKQWAFGIATAVTALAGAMLIIVGPVEPGLDRVYIGRTFAVVVLAGLGSMTGTVAAGLVLGISESIVLIHPNLGASWAPAVSFALLLLVLGVRPQGMFGR
jgi:branched-chain amino acid transport system permease protein